MYQLLCEGPSEQSPKRPFMCKGINPDGTPFDEGQFLFSSAHILDICIRFGALILMLVNFIIYFFAFGRKKTTLTLLFFSLLLATTFGTAFQWMIKANFIARMYVQLFFKFISFIVGLFKFIFLYCCFYIVLKDLIGFFTFDSTLQHHIQKS
jgi:hypothetical protein